MKDFRLDVINRPLFVLGVSLLLVNDFYLKYEYGNWLTGKLSDLAGLFVFPYFFSSLKIGFSRQIYLTTAVLFVFWKSSASQLAINWVQSIGLGVNRTVDYSDLVALLVLPFSFQHFKAQLNSRMKTQKALTVAFSIISLCAFWATTLPRERVEVNIGIDRSYQLEMSKTDFFSLLTAGHPYSQHLERNLTDSAFYLTFDIEDYQAQVRALATVKSIDSSHTLVRLDSILYGYITGELFSGADHDEINRFKALASEDYEKYFEDNFIEPVRMKEAEYLYYDNKEIDDSYQEK